MASGLNKPNKQTIMRKSAVHEFFQVCPVNKIPKLGVRLGKEKKELLVKKLKDRVPTVGSIHQNISEKQLIVLFTEEKAAWLLDIANGIDDEPVTNKGTFTPEVPYINIFQLTQALRNL